MVIEAKGTQSVGVYAVCWSKVRLDGPLNQGQSRAYVQHPSSALAGWRMRVECGPREERRKRVNVFLDLDWSPWLPRPGLQSHHQRALVLSGCLSPSSLDTQSGPYQGLGKLAQAMIKCSRCWPPGEDTLTRCGIGSLTGLF